MKNSKIIKPKKTKPFFSIITVVKNDEINVVKTIKSVVAQSLKDFEYIIIDGKSSDNTLKKIMIFKKKINFIISEKDKGIYFAMNKGAKISNGKVILFVNSGDILTKNALKIIKKKFIKNMNIGFIFGTVKRHYTTGPIYKYGINEKRLLYNFDFATSHSTGFFIKKDIFKRMGYFNTNFKISADYDLYFKLIIKNKIKGISTKKNELIGVMKSGGYSSKISFINHLKEEIKIRYHNGQNLFFLSLIFFNSIIKNLFK